MTTRRKKLSFNLIRKPNFWYLVGLITADGCLSNDGRHIDITLKEREHLIQLKERLGLKGGICKKQGSYRIQISYTSLYRFLTSVGLMPAKSLKLGSLEIPRFFFRDFLRGAIDGDGCIRRWTHPTNQGEQWSLRIYSGSESFVRWLADMTKKIIGAEGKIHIDNKRGASKDKTLYILKYGKMAAKAILNECYYPDAICLERKGKLARECVRSYKGWEKSKTTICPSFLIRRFRIAPGW